MSNELPDSQNSQAQEVEQLAFRPAKVLSEPEGAGAEHKYEHLKESLDQAASKGADYLKRYAETLRNESAQNQDLKSILPKLEINQDGSRKEELVHDGEANTSVVYDKNGEALAFESYGQRIEKHEDNKWWVVKKDGGYNAAGVPRLEKDGSVVYSGTGFYWADAYKLGLGKIVGIVPEEGEAAKLLGLHPGKQVDTRAFYKQNGELVAYESFDQRIEKHADDKWWVRTPLGGFNAASRPELLENGVVLYRGKGLQGLSSHVLGYKYLRD